MWKHCTSINKGVGFWAALALALTALPLSLYSQGTPPPTGVQPAQKVMSTSAGGFFESNTFLEMANRVFDPSSDSMDFENGSFQWKGKSFDLAEQRAFRSRFERFLLVTPSDEETQYDLLLDDIIDRLSVSNNNTEDALLDTWELLFRASRFDLDGGNSTIVANQVFNAWRIRKESRGVAMSQRELLQIRQYQQSVVANRAQALERIKDKRINDPD